MAKIILYHGTSISNADKIEAEGFKQSPSNWDGDVVSKEGFVYLTSAYAIYFATHSAKEGDKMASILAVEVDEADLFPDEDYISFKEKRNQADITICDMLEYQPLAIESLQRLGNVSVRLGSRIDIIGRRDFVIRDMFMYSDPSISPLNFSLLGRYYETLTHKVFHGDDLSGLNMMSFIPKVL